MKSIFQTSPPARAVAILACVVSLTDALAHDGHLHGAAEDLDRNRPPAVSGESIFQLESSWTDQGGKKVALARFRGGPTVFAMVYTSCQAACPIITADMQRIEKTLPPVVLDRTQFVLVSFDPERDTPAKLGKFAMDHGLDLKRWTLLTGSQGSVRELAAALGIKYKKAASGDFSHSNVITILDSGGIIRHQQVGLRQDPRASVDVVSGLSKPSS